MKRAHAIDVLRVAAIFGVVLIHVTSRSLALGHYDIIGMREVFFLERLGRFSIVLFFIISGYVLAMRYGNDFTIGQFYKKRLSRLFIPYAVWGFFYALYNNKFHLTASSFWSIFDGSMSLQMYFVPVLFVIYIFFPLIRTVRFTKTTFALYTLVEFVLLTVDYFYPISVYSTIKIAAFCLYPFIVGMLTFFHQKSVLIFGQKYMYWLFIALVVNFYLLYQSTFYLFLPHESISYIDSQWQPLIFLYGMLVWFIAFPFFSKHTVPFVSRLSKLVFFVFFVHPLLLSLFWKIKGAYLYSLTQSHILFTWWFTPCVFLFVVGCSFAVGFALQYIPKIRVLTGIDK